MLYIIWFNARVGWVWVSWWSAVEIWVQDERILACLSYYLGQWNEIDCRVQEAKRLMGLEVREDGVKKANSLESWSDGAFIR